MTSNDQNVHIAEFLDYYFKLPSPQYAVMLHAPWGAGKTWFIKEYLKSLPQEIKPIYVTLNGVSSKTEIEEQFFEQVHPFLAHKATKIGAKVLKGVLKGTLQIDWNSDGKADASASVGIPDIGIKDFLTKSKYGSIIVFDDIERCELPLHQLLGYINYFVEHDDTRVVLLANEDEIFLKERREQLEVQTGEEMLYRRVREKLIGKTFEIRPNVDSALDHFLSEIQDQGVQTILTGERALIRELHASSKSNNLRHLRQALLDFERILMAIDPSTRNSDMLRGIMSTFLIYSFEIRSGHLRPEQLRGLESWVAWMQEDVQDLGKGLQRKYPQLQKLDSIFSGELWTQIVGNGFIDRVAIAAAITQSKFYAKESDRPDWLRLNEAFEMDDTELAELVGQVKDRLDKNGYLVLGELMHVTGSLVSLASIGIGSQSEAEIVNTALANVEAMKSQSLLPLSAEEQALFGPTGWAGRSFHGEDRPEFGRFLKEVQRIKSEATVASYPGKAAELLDRLQTKNSASFSADISWNREGAGRYSREPVLAYIQPQEFVNAIALLNAKQLADVARAIEIRYQSNRSDLMREKGWLDQVAILLAPSAEKKGRMSDFYRRLLREKINAAREQLPDQATLAVGCHHGALPKQECTSG